MRLFACACCRRVVHTLSAPTYQRSIDVGELNADGLVPVEECRKAHQFVYDFRRNCTDLAVAWHHLNPPEPTAAPARPGRSPGTAVQSGWQFSTIENPPTTTTLQHTAFNPAPAAQT